MGFKFLKKVKIIRALFKTIKKRIRYQVFYLEHLKTRKNGVLVVLNFLEKAF